MGSAWPKEEVIKLRKDYVLDTKKSRILNGSIFLIEFNITLKLDLPLKY